MKIYKGSLDTRHYEFECYSLDEDTARKTLKRGWNKWRKISGATLTWKELWEGGDAYVMPFVMDVAYQDREPLEPVA